MPDLDLSRKLHFAESDFLAALESGTTMLASYYQTWSSLPGILRTASKTGNVGRETLSLAHSIASRIENIASCFLDIKRGEKSYTTSLHGDCDAMLHQMATLDLNANTKPMQADNENDNSCSHPSRAAIPGAQSSRPSFVATAHQWLLDNLHNPYPSAEVKARMAVASSCEIPSINSWFINARRRIGWTDLCRKSFSNRRTDMLDAAYRSLVEEDPQHPLSPELMHSFVKMKVAAEGLYSSTFTRSAFVGDLDAIVKDMTVKNGRPVGIEKCSRVRRLNLTKAVQNAYPSPESSVSSSPAPAVGDSITEESEGVDATPPIFAGSKRRRSSLDPVDRPPSTGGRSVKRLCVLMTSRTCFPSRPSGMGDIDESSDRSLPGVSPAHSTETETNEVLASQERRLPDTDVTGIPEHPSDTTALHAASDPLLRLNMGNEYSIDDWFETNFDDLFAIPPPVDATEPDFSIPWEVELFKDYSIPGNPKYAAKSLPTPTDLSNLDDLLQSVGGNSFFTSLDNVLSTTATEPAYMALLDSSIPDITIDWTSLNVSETYQPTICSTFPQYPVESQPLTELGLSMLQLPQPIPAVHPQDDFASKQAKLHQLHAMQEAVWRMEQQLRSEGVVV